MQDKLNPKVSDQTISLLAVQWLSISKFQGSFNGETVKNIEICGKIVQIDKGRFHAELLIQDFTGTIKVITYFIADKQIYYGLTENVQENCYVRVFCVVRIEERSTSLIVKLAKLIENRTELNDFFSESLIFSLKPCKLNIKPEILQVLWENQLKKMDARAVQSALSTYISLWNIEKVLISLIDEGLIDYGEDFNTYKYISNL